MDVYMNKYKLKMLCCIFILQMTKPTKLINVWYAAFYNSFKAKAVTKDVDGMLL